MATNRIIEPLTFTLANDGKAYARLSIEPDELKQVVISLNGLTEYSYYNLSRDGRDVIADGALLDEYNSVSADYWVIDTSTSPETSFTAQLDTIESKLDDALADTTATITQSDKVANAFAILESAASSAEPDAAIGMNRFTGMRLSGRDHLEQSVTTIILTMLHLRVMRRLFGCELIELSDYPQDTLIRGKIIAMVSEALALWEPRFTLKRVKLSATTEEQKQGSLNMALSGLFRGKDIEIGVVA